LESPELAPEDLPAGHRCKNSLIFSNPGQGNQGDFWRCGERSKASSNPSLGVAGLDVEKMKRL
jgi:hypothetical protein